MPEENNNAQEVTVVKSVKAKYGTTRVLKMMFTCNGGRTLTWNLKYPKEGLTKLEVETFMNGMISDNMILYGNDEASEIKDTYIYETRTLEIPAS